MVPFGMLHRYFFPGLRICCDNIDAVPMLVATMPWTLDAVTATLSDTDLNTFSWQCFAADPSSYHIASSSWRAIILAETKLGVDGGAEGSG